MEFCYHGGLYVQGVKEVCLCWKSKGAEKLQRSREKFPLGEMADRWVQCAGDIPEEAGRWDPELGGGGHFWERGMFSSTFKTRNRSK